MYRVTFELGAFRRGADRQKLGHMLGALLGALFDIDKAYLRDHRDTPELYSSGVRYKAEPLGLENWRDIPRLLETRLGDCEDLACWRAAELAVRRNVDARPVYRWRVLPTGATLYHIVVSLPNGQIEDPSARLGMKKGT